MMEKAIILSEGRNYLDIKPAKSLDIRDYNFDFPELRKLSVEDGCTTLNAFTAECIVRALEWVKAAGAPIPKTWVTCGGGTLNLHLCQQIRGAVSKACGFQIDLKSADALGWSSMAMEAELFAFLAVRVAKQLPITFPRTTGVREPMTGGKIFIPQ